VLFEVGGGLIALERAGTGSDIDRQRRLGAVPEVVPRSTRPSRAERREAVWTPRREAYAGSDLLHLAPAERGDGPT